MSANNSTQPVARLKRRILLRRPADVRKSSASLEDDSQTRKDGTQVSIHSSATTNETTLVYTKDHQDSPRHSTKITQLRQRPKSAYEGGRNHALLQDIDATNKMTVVSQNGRKESQTLCEKTPQLRERPKSSYGRPTSTASLHSANLINEEMVVQRNDSKNSPKTPRSRQRIKTYLERWKEAQFESRPCTAIGLMELERKQRDFIFSKETKSRKEAPMQMTLDTTRPNNGSAHAKDPGELLMKMKSLKQALESVNQNHQRAAKNPSAEGLLVTPKTPSTIKCQRERLENLIHNSKVCITERSQTSLGSLTSNTDQLVNLSGKNKITRDHNAISRKFETRPKTHWVIARGRDRPCTPGNLPRAEDRPHTQGIHSTINGTSVLNDTVGQISDVMDPHKNQNKDRIEVVHSVLTDYGQSPSDKLISTRRNLPAGRIIAARGRYTNTDSYSKVELDQGNCSVIRPSNDDWSGKRKEAINRYSKNYSTRRNISSNDNGNMLIPKSQSVHDQISARLITDQLDPKAGRLIVDQLKERYNRTTATVATPTSSQAIRCQSTPIALREGKSIDLEGAQEQLLNREDSILSWLEDCDESSLLTHLPVISSTEKASK